MAAAWDRQRALSVALDACAAAPTPWSTRATALRRLIALRQGWRRLVGAWASLAALQEVNDKLYIRLTGSYQRPRPEGVLLRRAWGRLTRHARGGALQPPPPALPTSTQPPPAVAVTITIVPTVASRALAFLTHDGAPLTATLEGGGKPGPLRARAAAVAAQMLGDLAPSLGPCVTYTMGLFDGGLLVVAPISAADLPEHGLGMHAVGRWRVVGELKEYDASPGARAARTACVRAAQLLGPSAERFDEDYFPVNGVGGVISVAGAWRNEARQASFAALLSRGERALQELRAMLLSTARARSGHIAECMAAWAERVLPPPLDEVPQPLRDACAVSATPALATLSFVHRAAVMPTPTLAPPAPQQPTSDFVPESVHDILEPWAFKAVRRKIAEIARWHRSEQRGDAAAKRPQPLALGVHAIKPAARGVVWDLRGGKPVPLDYGKRAFDTHLNLAYMRTLFADCADRELVDMLCDGVQLKADLAHQIVIMPNLLSLYTDVGVDAVADELDDMLKRDWWGSSCFLPFVPWRASPRGAVPRPQGGPPRGIGDLGAPRPRCGPPTNPSAHAQPSDELAPGLLDTAGAPVHSVNLSTRCGHRQAAMARRLRLDPRTDAWWPEVKPTLGDVATNGAILQHAANLTGEVVITIAFDFSKFFHQMFFHPSSYWMLGSIMAERNHEAGGASDRLRCMTEYVMTMGLSPASQLAQRLANAIMQAFCRRFDAEEERHRDQLPGEHRDWLAARASLPHDDYGTMARLFDATCYTDDPLLQVVGAARAVRALAVWHGMIGDDGARLMAAKQAKWQVSIGAIWTGIGVSPALGIVWVPRAKALRAIADINIALSGAMSAESFRSLLGFLEHLVEPMRMRRDDVDHLWALLNSGAGDSDIDPGTVIAPDGRAKACLAKWACTLATSPGSPIAAGIARSPPERSVVSWRPQSDAAVGDVAPDGRAGLGGYLYGYYWTLQTMAPITIPVAEFAAAIINVIVFYPLLARAQCVVLEIDALATPTVLHADRARSPGLREALRATRDVAQFQRMLRKLHLQHVYGENNTAADAASRGKWDVLRALARAFGHRLRRVEPPPDAIAYLNAVLGALGLALHSPPPSLTEEAPPPGELVQLAGDGAIGRVHTSTERIPQAHLARCAGRSPLAPPAHAAGPEGCLAVPPPAALGDAAAAIEGARERELARLTTLLRAGRDVQLACSPACTRHRRANPLAPCHVIAIADALRQRALAPTAEPSGDMARLRGAGDGTGEEGRRTLRPRRRQAPFVHLLSNVPGHPEAILFEHVPGSDRLVELVWRRAQGVDAGAFLMGFDGFGPWMTADEIEQTPAHLGAILTMVDVAGAWQPHTIAKESLSLPSQWGLFAARPLESGDAVGAMDGATLVGSAIPGSQRARALLAASGAARSEFLFEAGPPRDGSDSRQRRIMDGRSCRQGGPRSGNDAHNLAGVSNNALLSSAPGDDVPWLHIAWRRSVPALNANASGPRKRRSEIFYAYGSAYWRASDAMARDEARLGPSATSSATAAMDVAIRHVAARAHLWRPPAPPAPRPPAYQQLDDEDGAAAAADDASDDKCSDGEELVEVDDDDAGDGDAEGDSDTCMCAACVRRRWSGVDADRPQVCSGQPPTASLPAADDSAACACRKCGQECASQQLRLIHESVCLGPLMPAAPPSAAQAAALDSLERRHVGRHHETAHSMVALAASAAGAGSEDSTSGEAQRAWAADGWGAYTRSQAPPPTRAQPGHGAASASTGDPAAPGGPAIRHMFTLSDPGDMGSPPPRHSVSFAAPGAFSIRTPDHLPPSAPRLPPRACKRQRDTSPLPLHARTPEQLDDTRVPPPGQRAGSFAPGDPDGHRRLRAEENQLALRAVERAHKRVSHVCAGVARATSSETPAADVGMRQRMADGMAAALRNDQSRLALKPDDAGVLDLACQRMVELLHGHVPHTTQHNEASNWKHWVVFCAHMNTSPWRDDASANKGGDGHERETHLLALGLLFIYGRMQPAKKSPDEPPKPASALAVLRGVRRIHKRMGYVMVDLQLAVRLAASLADEYVLEHGPELLQPKRTEPLTNAQIEALVNVPSGVIAGGRTHDRASLRDTSFRACFATMARTGFRADETALRSGAPHTAKRLSRWHLRWIIDGVVVPDPPSCDLEGLKTGDAAVLIPPTSKADQFGLEWGPSPIYLRYDDAETVNAARELRDLELAWPLHGAERRAQPLFVDGAKQPLGQDALRAEFAARLRAGGVSEAVIATVSLHSFRVYLACALLALGRSHDEIKALLRWKSDEALRIYARLNAKTYADLLVGVGSAEIESQRSHNLPQSLTVDARAGQLREARQALETAARLADQHNARGGDGPDEGAPAEGGEGA